MIEYIGCHVTKLLWSEPFKSWPLEKSVDDEPAGEIITCYVFNGNGLELHCDCDDNIGVIFLYSEEYGGFDEALFDLPFTLNRNQVLVRLGAPSRNGKKISDPILGECGAWDRFARSDVTIHIEYKIDADKINKITLMRNDISP